MFETVMIFYIYTCNAEREMSASACTRSVASLTCFCASCVAAGGEVRQRQETVDLLKDYVVQLHRSGHLWSMVQEVPGADGLTTAYRFQGTHTRYSTRS